jgi:Domain of unknown function (DUF1707)/Domain of unknown function (DUF4190)
MSYDEPRPDLRASDADREETAKRLHFAATEGRLDADELDERLSAVYASKFCHELAPLVADVTPPPVPAPTPRPVFIRPAPTTNALAICSLISAALWMGGFGSILAVLLGHAALRQISRAEGRQGGRGLALAGLTLGYLSLLLFALLVISVAVS